MSELLQAEVQPGHRGEAQHCGLDTHQVERFAAEAKQRLALRRWQIGKRSVQRVGEQDEPAIGRVQRGELHPLVALQDLRRLGLERDLRRQQLRGSGALGLGARGPAPRRTSNRPRDAQRLIEHVDRDKQIGAGLIDGAGELTMDPTGSRGRAGVLLQSNQALGVCKRACVVLGLPVDRGGATLLQLRQLGASLGQRRGLALQRPHRVAAGCRRLFEGPGVLGLCPSLVLDRVGEGLPSLLELGAQDAPGLICAEPCGPRRSVLKQEAALELGGFELVLHALQLGARDGGRAGGSELEGAALQVCRPRVHLGIAGHIDHEQRGQRNVERLRAPEGQPKAANSGVHRAGRLGARLSGASVDDRGGASVDPGRPSVLRDRRRHRQEDGSQDKRRRAQGLRGHRPDRCSLATGSFPKNRREVTGMA